MNGWPLWNVGYKKVEDRSNKFKRQSVTISISFLLAEHIENVSNSTKAHWESKKKKCHTHHGFSVRLFESTYRNLELYGSHSMIWDTFLFDLNSRHFCIESWSFLSTFPAIHFRRSSEPNDFSLAYLSSILGRNTFLDFFTTTLDWRNSFFASSSSSLIFEAV